MSSSQGNFSEAGVGTYSTSAAQTLYSKTIDENSSGVCVVRASARRVSDGAAKSFVLEFGFKRSTGDVEVFGVNVLSAKGTTLDLIALAAVTITADSSSEDFRLRVTGLASQEIDWSSVADGMLTIHVED